MNFLFPDGFNYPDIHIPTLTGEPLFASIPWYTNTHFTMLLVIAALSGLAFAATRNMREVPRGFQNAVEMVVGGLYEFVESVGGREAAKRIPVFGTVFLFILVSNWLTVLPFMGQVHWLHKPTADYHVNIALAIGVFGLYQFSGFRVNGLGYMKRWFNLSGFKEGILVGVILFFVGLIEFFSELFRLLTLTLRLWGNMVGGEIALGVMSALLLVPGFALPFLGLEILVGLVQALVFMLLAIMYLVFAIESHEESHDEKHEEGQHKVDREVYAQARAA